MIIIIDLSEEEIDLLDSCVRTTEREGYDVTDDKKVIAKIREAVQHSVQSDGLRVLECAECGEQTSMNHKESCSKRRR